MATKIRQSLFETNSSSTHSLSLGVYSTNGACTIPVENGVVSIKMDGDYGWGIETFTDQYEIARYLLQQALVQYYRPEYTTWISNIVDVIKEVTGAESVVISGVSFDEEDSNRLIIEGYVDHQSVGEFNEVLKDKNLIKNAIFGDGSLLVIDNDNH